MAPTSSPSLSSSTTAPADSCVDKDAPPQASGDESGTDQHDGAVAGAASIISCSAALLNLPPDVIPLHILPNLNASSALNFALTSKASLAFFDDERHFRAALRRDFGSPTKGAAAKAKEEYYLQLSIMCGYDPRWYRLSTLGNNVAKSRQGFGKSVLLGHPVVFGGWATDSRGFFDIESDVVYLSEQSTMSTGAQYQWKRLRIANAGDAPQYATYCTAALGVDDVPLSQLINVNGFADLARARHWNVEDGIAFPVLFVSGGVAEGAYRCATSFLHAIIGGQKQRQDTSENEKKDTSSNKSDNMEAYDWCRLEMCGGVFNEIPANERSLAAAREWPR